MTLRLATYNIHKFVGSDGKRDEERILSVIRAIDADVLGLQEVVLEDRSGDLAAVETFARKAGYRAIAQPFRRAAGMVQFNLLLTRPDVKSHSLIGLPRNGTEPRGAIIADLDAGGRTLQVAVTHLALSLSGRRRQLAKLLEVTLAQTETPFALLADLNAMFAWEGARRILNSAFPGQGNIASFPARFPLLALDTIRVRPVEAIRSFAAFREGEARHASDHLPLIADIALP